MKYNLSVQPKLLCHKIMVMAATLVSQFLHPMELFMFGGSKIGQRRTLSFYQTLNPSWDFLLSLINSEALDTLNSTDPTRLVCSALRLLNELMFVFVSQRNGYAVTGTVVLTPLRCGKSIFWGRRFHILYYTEITDNFFLYAQQSIADRCWHIPENHGG
jgi:hypothetical protein